MGNIAKIWDEFTGADVHVGVYDDGVQYSHHDLDNNYDSSRHVLVQGQVIDAFTLPGNPHGTSVSGLIAAENDGVGTVGVAFGSTITGVDIFGGRITDVNASPAGFLEAAAQMSTFDITNNSWGRTPNFAISAYDIQSANVYEHVVAVGRDGLGTIVVQASGNDNMNANGSERNASRAPPSPSPPTTARAAPPIIPTTAPTCWSPRRRAAAR